MEGRTECLECHKWFRKLSIHLSTHSLTADDYRGLHGFRLGQDINAEATKSNNTSASYQKGKKERGQREYQIEKEVDILKLE